MIYLDNSATTRVMPCAAEAALRYMQQGFFNPSAAYGPAAAVEREIGVARAHLAETLGLSADGIVYTSCATESNNMAILGTIGASRLKTAQGKYRIITTESEHPSVYEVCRELDLRGRAEVIYLPADPDGSVSLDALSGALTQDTVLVSLMHVNSETGAVSDIGAAAKLVRSLAPEAVFHVDGVQAYAKLPFAPVPADLYTISGHKLHAPKGIGVLAARKGLRVTGGLIGGGQESGRRSGTTNAPGIMALDAAVMDYRAHQEDYIATMRALKLRLAENLSAIEDSFINGPAPEAGAPQILNVSFPGVRGEVLLHALEQKQIYVSTGSACSSHKKGKNRVLSAIHVTGRRQEGTIRLSLCPFNTEEEIDTASEEIRRQVAFLRRYQRR